MRTDRRWCSGTGPSYGCREPTKIFIDKVNRESSKLAVNGKRRSVFTTSLLRLYDVFLRYVMNGNVNFRFAKECVTSHIFDLFV